jgi:hypothetical protein
MGAAAECTAGTAAYPNANAAAPAANRTRLLIVSPG